MERNLVFISYSHQDNDWRVRLQKALKPSLRKKKFALWDDTKIETGEEWRKEIEEALERAVVAVLLVSIDFLDSDFIAENELPPLIEKAEQQGTRIVWVPIGYADYEESPIWNYQAAWKPENPLESLSPADQNKALVAIAREIKKASASTASVTKPKREIPLLETAKKSKKASVPAPASSTEEVESNNPIDKANPGASNTLTWLHLSDFHFKKDADWQQDVVLKALMRDVIAKLPGEGLQPDMVFFTGDIAHSGKKQEYKGAMTFLDKLANELGHQPAEQWFLVPGNHDVDRSLINFPDKSLRYAITEETVREALGDQTTWNRFASRQADFLGFTELFLGTERAWRAETPWRVEAFETKGLKIAVLCLNSAWACQDDQDKGNIFLGKYQVRQAVEEADKLSPDLKIALFHHPFDHLKAFDGKKVEALLSGELGCHFLLRGHLHEADIRFKYGPDGITRSLATGACWQDAKHPHSVMAVQLDPAAGTGTVHVWTYTSKGRGYWARDNHLYENMDNGRWRFDFPKAWNIKTPAVVADPEDEPKGPLIPPPYLRHLRDQFGNLESLITSSATSNTPLVFKLQKIYIPLKMSWLEAERRKELEKRMLELEKKNAKSEKKAEALEQAKPEIRPLTELLKLPKHRHFLVSGGAGSGKSTFVQYVALHEIDEEEPRLPLLLPLKEFGVWLKSKDGVRAEWLLAWTGEVLSTLSLDKKALSGRSGKGEIIWLLDGLDEIFEESIRLRAAQIIGNWMRQEGNEDRLIITTRPHAHQQTGILKALGLQEHLVEVMPFDVEDQKTYLKRWFETVYEGSPILAGERRTELWGAMARNEGLKGMRDNPLLLSTIAAIFQQGRKLPERRADLYGKAVLILLEKRFGPMAGGSENLIRRMRLGLMKVARGMMEKGLARDIGERDFLDLLDRGFYRDKNKTAEEHLDLEKMISDLTSRSGLLSMKGDPCRYSFSHLGFQEYLAARDFGTERDPLTHVKPYLDEGEWKEVILLVSGHLFESGVAQVGEDFVRGLMESGKEGNTNHLVLALEAASEAPEDGVPDNLLNELREQAMLTMSAGEKVEVTQRIEVGRGLGKLGDPRLDPRRKDHWVKFDWGSLAKDDNALGEMEPKNGFFMSRYPVTNVEYGAFLKAGGYKNRKWWDEAGWKWKENEKITAPGEWKNPEFNEANQPVVEVSWFEAAAYCRWLTESLTNKPPKWWKAGMTVYLPTEKQWEYAARGKEERKYAWGSTDPNPELANYDGNVGKTTPVGVYPKGATPEGMLDMTGNVDEWCADWYDEDKVDRAPRGGSWADSAGSLAASDRFGIGPGSRFRFIGFRVAVSAPAEHVAAPA